MKRIFIFLSFILLIACSAQKQLIQKNNELSTAEADTSSNYILFNYINSLESKDYFTVLDSLKNGRSDDFFTLRMAYTKTKDYSP